MKKLLSKVWAWIRSEPVVMTTALADLGVLYNAFQNHTLTLGLVQTLLVSLGGVVLRCFTSPADSVGIK